MEDLHSGNNGVPENHGDNVPPDLDQLDARLRDTLRLMLFSSGMVDADGSSNVDFVELKRLLLLEGEGGAADETAAPGELPDGRGDYVEPEVS